MLYVLRNTLVQALPLVLSWTALVHVVRQPRHSKKKKQHRSGCHNTSQESNVNHWPTLPLIYSCIANTKTPNPCGICHLTPQESFYGVMSSRPIVINEPPHSSACLSINFQGGPPSYVPTLLCSGRTWNNCHAKSRTFPFLILRVNSILIQF